MVAAAGWGDFELPASERSRLVRRTVAWTAASLVAAGVLVTIGVGPGSAQFAALVVGVGLAAARPVTGWLLPLVGLAAVGATLLLDRLDVPVALAAGAVAGLLAGGGGLLGRAEAVLAGAGATGLAHWVVEQLPVVGLPYALLLGAALGLASAQSLVPAALRFVRRQQLPPGRVFAQTLAEGYRPPCYRALQLDAELSVRAPDRETRRGLGEVAAWVYQLALTQQQLDQDLAAIDPTAVAARRAALDVADVSDPFIAERRKGTADHLDRLLHHRTVLERERARAASLQEYAVAYLEEARAGLALAGWNHADAPPAQLDEVLTRLRAHSVDVGARRATERELAARSAI